MIKSDSVSKLAVDLVNAQLEMGAALKDAKNPFFKSKYADLNSVIDAAIPVMNKNNITVLQPTLISETGARVVRTTLLHASGEYLCSDTEIVCAKQNDPQAYGSAISYARRYGLQAFVSLKTSEDDDGEKAMGRPAPTEAAKPTAEQPTRSSFRKPATSGWE